MNGWLAVVVGLVGALFGTAGAAPIILAIARRKTITASAEVALSEEARQWVADFQEDARAARAEAAAARADAAAVHRELRSIRVEAEQVSRYLLKVMGWIDQPGMNIGRLRALVAGSSPIPIVNGTPGKPGAGEEGR